MDIFDIVPWWLAFMVMLAVLIFEIWYLTKDRKIDN